jgi:sulfonate transport system substrate-binding protein
MRVASEAKVARAATQPWPDGEAIIVAKDSPIRTIKDLKGKKVSYPRATNAQWVLTKALRKEGLSLSDVESALLLPGTNILSVLQTGGVDAAVFIDASLSSYTAEGARKLVSAGDVDTKNSLLYIASEKAIKAISRPSAPLSGN